MSEVMSSVPKLRDASILVAVTAVGFALSRMSTVSLNETTFREKPLWILVVSGGWFAASAYFIAPMFVMWSAAVVVMGLISPGFSRIRQGPGWVGAVAVSFVVLTTSVAEIAYRWPIPSGHAMAADVLRSWDQRGFQALVSAWIALWIAGAWRASSAWPDRLGRWLGWVWIVLGVLYNGMVFVHSVVRYSLRLM